MKITDLEAMRSGIIDTYNPTKGLENAAIDKIDARKKRRKLSQVN